jgi:glycosyltransferase involved in cell wall biosynthesis/SAM-dependent methyltransferase
VKLSVVIPAHDEADSIASTVTSVAETLTGAGIDHEILVVDDHSTDGTAEIVERIAREGPGVRLVRSTYKPGYGFTVRAGLDNFTGDAVAIVMGDSSDDPEDLVRYHRVLEDGYDCAFGSRFVHGARVHSYPFAKLVLNRTANRFIQGLFRHGYNDTTNAFKAYRREVVAGIQPLLSNHFNLTVEMPLKAIVRGYSYAVVPISWTNRTAGTSKLLLKEMGSRYLFIVLYVFLEHHLTRGDYRRPDEVPTRLQRRRRQTLAGSQVSPMRTRRVSDPFVRLLRCNRHVYWAARKARAGTRSLAPARDYPGVRGRIHPNDSMLEDRSLAGVEHYRQGGLNVIVKIEESLNAAGRRWEEIGTWLDFGCGYGRVLRNLVARVPPARVYAADVTREAVDFCASEFGIRPVHLDREPAAVELPEVDFLYAISIVTHLTAQDARATLDVLGKTLKPGGIGLFTTHGRRSLERIERYGEQYGPLRSELAERVQDHGVAFVPYPFALQDDYGMTWHSEAYVRQTMTELHGETLELLLFQPHGLDDHQDVFAFRRVA